MGGGACLCRLFTFRRFSAETTAWNPAAGDERERGGGAGGRIGEAQDWRGAREKEVKRGTEEWEKVPFDYYQHCPHLHMHSSATQNANEACVSSSKSLLGTL